MDDDHLKVMEKEGYLEAPGAEVFKSTIRKSSRLQSMKKISSCSKYLFQSYRNSSKYTITSSKKILPKENSIYESKIQEEKKHQFPYRNETDGVFSADTASMKSSTVVPSFEYHVQAKEGIDLVVDLNLRRSDWLKSMAKAVSLCQNHPKPALESFRKEVECLEDGNNFKVNSPDKTSASDASMNSYVQKKFSIKSVSRENGKTLPSVVEKEVISVRDFKRCQSKVDQKSELILESSLNSEKVQLLDFSSPYKGSLCSRTVQNEEGINSAEGMEVAGREENTFVISASDDEPKRKKRDYQSDHIHGQSHDRILRSTEVFGGKVIEHDGVVIWRSSRLHSKVVR